MKNLFFIICYIIIVCAAYFLPGLIDMIITLPALLILIYYIYKHNYLNKYKK